MKRNQNKHVTPEQVEYIRSIAATHNAAEISALFEQKYGQKRNRNGIQTICRRFGIKYKKRPNSGRFEKGMTTWNKGLKGVNGQSETRFKKGHKTWTCRPIGSIRKTKQGHILVKVGEPKVWKRQSIINWEAVHGPIESGSILMHRDGDTENCDLSNLALITRGENVLFNKFFREAYGNAELFDFALLTVRLWLKSNQLKKNGSKT
jgi:hypothetical protein